MIDIENALSKDHVKSAWKDLFKNRNEYNLKNRSLFPRVQLIQESDKLFLPFLNAFFYKETGICRIKRELFYKAVPS